MPLGFLYLRRPGQLDRGYAPRWKQHPKCAALPGLALYTQRAMVAANDSQDSRKSQAAARELSGEERIENTGECLLIHSATRIGNFDEDILTGRDPGSGPDCENLIFIDRDGSSHDRDYAGFVTERIRCIGQQVHQHLPDLCGVSVDRGWIRS